MIPGEGKIEESSSSSQETRSSSSRIDPTLAHPQDLPQMGSSAPTPDPEDPKSDSTLPPTIPSPGASESGSKQQQEEEEMKRSFLRNSIKSRFSFEIPPKSEPRIITIQEVMSESSLNFLLPQMMMWVDDWIAFYYQSCWSFMSIIQSIRNIFMEDEKLLMNCVTYSLGEVKSEYQRCQMRVLESHLRMVNLMTESLNNIHHHHMMSGTDSRGGSRHSSVSSGAADGTAAGFTQSSSFFRPSTAKKELYLQFVPLNFHLQHFTLVKTKGAKRKHSNAYSTIHMIPTSPIADKQVNILAIREQEPATQDSAIKDDRRPSSDDGPKTDELKEILVNPKEPNGNIESILMDDSHELLNDDNHNNLLDVYTVGSFAAHNLDFESGGMKRIFETRVGTDARTPTNNNRVRNFKPGNCYRIWRCMRDAFHVNFYSAKMESLLQALVDQIRDQHIDPKSLQETYSKIEMTGKKLAVILDPREVDTLLYTIDDVRQQEILTQSMEEDESHLKTGFPGPDTPSPRRRTSQEAFHGSKTCFPVTLCRRPERWIQQQECPKKTASRIRTRRTDRPWSSKGKPVLIMEMRTWMATSLKWRRVLRPRPGDINLSKRHHRVIIMKRLNQLIWSISTSMRLSFPSAVNWTTQTTSGQL